VDWRQRNSRTLPRVPWRTRARGAGITRTTFLSCGLPVSRRHPSGLVLYGLGTPASWLHHRAVFEQEAPVLSNGVTFLRLRPHFRVWLALPDACWCKRTHSHEVCRPHSATHPLRSTTPRLCLPGSCCVLALTMCLDAFLPLRTPWCPSNQVRSRGGALQSFTWQRSPSPLGGASPLAISDRPQSADTRPAFSSHLPRIGRHEDRLVGQTN